MHEPQSSKCCSTIWGFLRTVFALPPALRAASCALARRRCSVGKAVTSTACKGSILRSSSVSSSGSLTRTRRGRSRCSRSSVLLARFCNEEEVEGSAATARTGSRPLPSSPRLGSPGWRPVNIWCNSGRVPTHVLRSFATNCCLNGAGAA